MLDTIKSIFVTLFMSIINFLPDSPFQQFIGAVRRIPYLKYLNWFFPVAEVLIVLQVWLSAVVLYYTYSAIMRFIKLI